MRYLIIGLGIYGSNLARDLTDMGHEVIGADVRAANVEAIKDYIATAYIVDSTDEASLAALPLKNVDLVIVAIGENFGASVKTVAILRKLGIRNIYARAIDGLHMSILEGLQVKRILAPEQRAAHDLVNEISFHSKVATLRIAQDSFIARFTAPDIFLQMKYADLTEEKLQGLTLIAASRPFRQNNLLGISHENLTLLPLPSPDLRVEQGDNLVCLGSASSFKALARLLS